MKVFDVIKLAAKTLKGRWAVLPVISFAVAAFCLCFAGAIGATVQEEKAQPYELQLSAQSGAGITDSTIADMLDIPDVLAATPILQNPATVQTGQYAAQLTLTGVEASYLEGTYTQGSAFPQDSVMPYIVLNEAACKQFAQEENDAEKELPGINWLGASYTLSLGEEGGGVISKVCGILSDGDDEGAEPLAYISLSAAKGLLRESNQPVAAQIAWARVADIGHADAVSRQVAASGLTVSNSTQELQAAWDVQTKEMAYLLVISALCLVSAAVLLAAQREIAKQKQRNPLEMFQWMGMKERSISRLFLLHALMIAMIGIISGIAVAMALPSFLPMELSGVSVYTLSIPLGVVAAAFGICVLAIIPTCFINIR